MAKQLFKGFKQVIFESGMTFENGYVYFVREDEDETKENGFIYFNGKKYGTTKAVADKLVELENSIAEVITTANAADTLSKENKGRLDSIGLLDNIGLSVVDGKLCVTFNQ